MKTEKKMDFNILTLFPKMFDAFFEESIIGRAVRENLVKVAITDIRDHTLDKHKRTDDYPYGGGAGMVMTADPVFRAIESVIKGTSSGASDSAPPKLIYMSPRGRIMDIDLLNKYAANASLLILCGHYEGIDERIIEHYDMDEVSIGDYILTGGELPAMVLVDALVRMLPGVLGSDESHEEESVYSGLLEYPQYTKPREYAGLNVPDVLYSGDHKAIRLWKLEKSLQMTAERRPDLFDSFMRKYMSDFGKSEQDNHENGTAYTKEEKQIIERVANNYDFIKK